MTVADGGLYVPPSAAATALAYLRSVPEVLAFLDGDPARVRAPRRADSPVPLPDLWPQLVISTATEPVGDLRHLVQGSVQVEAWGDPGGGPSPQVLRDLLVTALSALTRMPRAPQPEPVVVTSGRVVANGGPSPLPTGQQRWVATVALVLHG